MLLHWLRTHAGRWHAWPTGGRRTLCGRVNVEHLKQRPATQIQVLAPTDGVLCSACARKGRAALAEASTGDEVSAWCGQIRRHLTHVRGRVAAKTITALAMRLAEVGSPASPQGQEVFEAIRFLLLTPRITRMPGARAVTTIPRLKEALAALPVQHGILTQITQTLRAWKEITGRSAVLDRFQPDRVIGTMVQLPTPAPYIAHLHARGFSHLSAVFHPNTLERAKKDTALRGLFSGSNEYWEDTLSQLHVVRD